ncbi:MAG: O-antigen ligase family protein [Patescibacteria group bacterium]|jgi:O-antigen ligase
MFEGITIAVFALLFLYLVWERLEWAITLTLILLPAYQLRFQLWFVPMTMLEVMLLLVFFGWALKCLYERRSFSSLRFPGKWPVVLFLLAGVVAVVISPDTRQALGLWKAYLLEPIMFYVVLVNTMKTEQQLRMLLFGFGVAILAIGYVVVLQMLDIVQIPNNYGVESPRRATSFFAFPTAVGKFVGPLVGLFLGLLFMSAKDSLRTLLRTKGFLVGVILFGLFGLVFSVTRGALLGVFVSMMFVAFFSPWKKVLWITISTVLFVALCIPQTRQNIVGVFETTDTSTDVHLIMWKGAWRIIQDHPIAGTGLASFPIVYDDYRDIAHIEFFPNPDHLILTLWIEMGLAGLLLFAWLMVRYFTAGVRLLRTNRPLAVGLMAAMIVLLVHGFLDTPYFKNDLAVIFWALFAMVHIRFARGVVKK